MIPDDLFPTLVKGAREAVWDAFAAAHRVTRHRVPEEIEHVWALVETGTARLAAEWRPVLTRRGVSLRVTGVLIHQTPKAHYDHPLDGPVKPELGDLLVVHDHVGAAPSRRALLLQAKRIVDGVPTSTPDVHQEYLYRHWPDFTLHGRGGGRPAAPYLPGNRTIRPNPGGSWYGLVDDDAHPHGRCAICYPQHAYLFPWMAADPTGPALAAGAEDLGSLLANMLYSTAYPRGRAAQQITGPLALSVAGAPNNHFDVDHRGAVAPSRRADRVIQTLSAYRRDPRTIGSLLSGFSQRWAVAAADRRGVCHERRRRGPRATTRAGRGRRGRRYVGLPDRNRERGPGIGWRRARQRRGLARRRVFRLRDRRAVQPAAAPVASVSKVQSRRSTNDCLRDPGGLGLTATIKAQSGIPF